MFIKSPISPIFNQPTTQPITQQLLNTNHPSINITRLSNAPNASSNASSMSNASSNASANASSMFNSPNVATNTTTQNTSLPTTQQLVVHESPEEKDYKDCKIALPDFKGKIQDAIKMNNNGVYKSSVKAFGDAIARMDIGEYAKNELIKNMQHALQEYPTIRRKDGKISYSSVTYDKILMDTLMAYKKKYGVVYRQNRTHPMRSRPNKKQRYSPYAPDKNKSPATNLPVHTMPSTVPHSNYAPDTPHTHQQTPGITVNTIPTLFPNSLLSSGNTVSIDDERSAQLVGNIRVVCDEILRVKSQYDTHKGSMSAEKREQYDSMYKHHCMSLRMMMMNQL
jgi:hypothetical protein